MSGFDTTLDRLIQELRDQAGRGRDSLRNVEAPEAENLGSEDTPAPKYSDTEKTTEHFEPDQSRTSYTAALRGEEGSNQVKTVMAAKLSTSMLATLEREYKSQRTNRVRRIAHEAARRGRQSEPKGSIQSYMRLPIQAILGRTKVGE